ncbi:hypothetical protein FIR75_22395 [Escherichia coli]|nr:hypothetical protein [Escherichia coli]
MILFHYGESWNLLRADQRLIFAKSWPRASRYQQGHQDLFILRSDLPSQVFIRRKVRRCYLICSVCSCYVGLYTIASLFILYSSA